MLLTTPSEVDFYVCIGGVGCVQPISERLCKRGIISLVVIKSAPNSASATEVIKNLIIFEIVSTGPFQLGSGSFLDLKYMGDCTAASLGFIGEYRVSMVCKDSVSGAINDTIIWICSNIIKELFDGCGSFCNGCCLLGSNVT